MKKKSIVVIGSDGFMGSRIIELLKNKFNLIGLNREKLDITNLNQVQKVLGILDFDWIVNAAAIAHIDNCEKDRYLGEKSESWKVNVLGPENLALVCFKKRKRLLHISTECIFDGIKGYFNERDKPNPINWYGETKYYGELKVMESGVQYCILRAVLAYGHSQFLRNDLTRIFYNQLAQGRPIRAVSDQYLNVTFIDDLVNTISILIENNAKGIYHYGGNTSLSPYKIAVKLKEIFRFKDAKITPVKLSEYFGKYANLRLKNATLLCNRIQKDFVVKLSDIKRAMRLLKERY